MAVPSYFKIEEIPVVSKFVYNSLTRDKAEFTAFSDAVFTDAYLAAFLAKITEVENLTGLMAYWAQMSRITKDLYLSVEGLRPILNKLEGYVKLAKKGLSIDHDKFGITELRKEIKNNNVEGIMNKLELVLQNAQETTNNAALKAKGMKDDLLTSISNSKRTVGGLNEQQQLKNTEKEEAVKNNRGVLEELWEITAEVIAAGKALYRIENKERVKDYTPSQLKKRVDAERNPKPEEPVTEKGELAVIVVNKSNDEVLEGAEVLIVETGTSDYTDEQGEAGLEEDPGTYTVEISMDGFNKLEVKNVEVKSGESTELSVELEPAPAEPTE